MAVASSSGVGTVLDKEYSLLTGGVEGFELVADTTVSYPDIARQNITGQAACGEECARMGEQCWGFSVKKDDPNSQCLIQTASSDIETKPGYIYMKEGKSIMFHCTVGTYSFWSHVLYCFCVFINLELSRPISLCYQLCHEAISNMKCFIRCRETKLVSRGWQV